jgi:hypothetical protein
MFSYFVFQPRQHCDQEALGRPIRKIDCCTFVDFLFTHLNSSFPLHKSTPALVDCELQL